MSKNKSTSAAAAWGAEVGLPNAAEIVGNTEIKTDQDVLNVPVSLRCSNNHEAMIALAMGRINDSTDLSPKKVKKGDIWRIALEFYNKNHDKI